MSPTTTSGAQSAQAAAVNGRPAGDCVACEIGQDLSAGRLEDPASPNGPRVSTLEIPDMDCADEEALIRKALGSMAGVQDLRFNLMARTLTVTHAAGVLPAVLENLTKLGMPAVPVADATGAETSMTPAGFRAMWKRTAWPRMAAAAVAAVAAEALDLAGVSLWVVITLAVLAIATAGLETYGKGWMALRHGSLSMNALMSIAVTGAFVIGEWPEAAMVMVLFALAETIEALSLDRARHAVRELMAMAPETATVRQDDGTWLEVLSAEVSVGAVVRVRPGERLALDGLVLEGTSSIDQAPITGESMPVDKAPDDQVFAGTINQAGSLVYEVTAPADASTISRIIHAVQEAQGAKAPTQRFVDRFARIYSPAVFAIALLVLAIPPMAFGEPWSTWIYRALVLLVIACPCALVISTPVTIVSGLASAARHGILIKGGVHLEGGRRLKALAVDKTGTLTVGKPSVVSAAPFGGTSLTEALHIAGALAGRSDHPVSRAVAAYAGDGGGGMHVDAFTALGGRGISGGIDGRTYRVGNHRLVHEVDHCTPAVEAAMEGLEREGKTAIALIADAGVAAVFGVADTVRETSREAVADLHRLGVRTIMLTGDNHETAAAVARQVGIDSVEAELLPEEKSQAVAQLSGRYGFVGMAGDGINDAPALAGADIGFAMGAAGSDTALETADVALMDDDLRKVPAFVRLSRRTARLLAANIAIALGIKAIFLALAVTGEATMWMAVFADMGATLIVVFNGMRLLSRRRWNTV